MIHSKRSLPQVELQTPPLSSCLAKTLTLPEGKTIPGIDVLGHCAVVGEIAKALIKNAPPWIQGNLFPPGSELVAAVHDVGKICPAFQKKIYRDIDGQSNSLPGLEKANPDQETSWGYHAGASQAALEDCPEYIPEIAGCHHGFSLRPKEKHPAVCGPLGGKTWQKLREELIGELKKHFAVDWPIVKDEDHAAVLAGLTCVADWIGSGSAFDRFRHIDDVDDITGRVKNALEAAGFIPPVMRQGLSFKDVFKFDYLPVQSCFVSTLSAPGVYILEAPMGIGKTEAALYAAYNIICAGKASGIYFALPTRLTSNKIHERMDKFLAAVLDEQYPLRQSMLLHSSAWVYETELGKEGQPGSSWFHYKKRGLLAPFAVGTIDQALMAVMNVKHGFVRAFGLAGKVVILDEVHSYDSYTGTLLEELVATLRKIGCTVIILSATLTDERRRALLGLGAKTDAPVSVYPLISALPFDENQVHEIPVKTRKPVQVIVRRISEDKAAVEEALKRAEEGQQVLWIENTVDEAQERFLELAARAAEFGVEVGLIHSRFVQSDREKNEKKWVELYGKEGKERRREKGRILVGTQVLEQSLDIDADFLVTRLCPTDMLLQRIGRLWRHDLSRPEGARQEVWILSADYKEVLENYKEKLGVSALIYAPYVLLRTLEIWEKQNTLELPGDIRRLVEATYSEREEKDILEKLKEELNTRKENLRRIALGGISHAGVTLPESTAETRYSEMETQEVLLLRRAEKNQDRSLSLILADGTPLELPWGLKSRNKESWRNYAAMLTGSVVSVQKSKAPLPVHPRILSWFDEYIYTGAKDTGTKEERDNSLRIALIKEGRDLTGIDYTEISTNYSLAYTERDGYKAKKKHGVKED